MNSLRRFVRHVTQRQRREPGRLNVVEEREGDETIGTDRDGPGERLVPPDDDLEHVFGPMMYDEGSTGAALSAGSWSRPRRILQEHQHQGPGDSQCSHASSVSTSFPHVGSFCAQSR